jgi:hypothetical protein
MIRCPLSPFSKGKENGQQSADSTGWAQTV